MQEETRTVVPATDFGTPYPRKFYFIETPFGRLSVEPDCFTISPLFFGVRSALAGIYYDYEPAVAFASGTARGFSPRPAGTKYEIYVEMALDDAAKLFSPLMRFM